MLRKYLWIFFISMVPLIELRGAIPYAKFMNMPMLNAYIVAIIGNMILDCGKPLSILYSDLREIDGVVCGQMVMQLPDDEVACERIRAFAASRGLELEDMNHV